MKRPRIPVARAIPNKRYPTTVRRPRRLAGRNHALMNDYIDAVRPQIDPVDRSLFTGEQQRAPPGIEGCPLCTQRRRAELFARLQAPAGRVAWGQIKAGAITDRRENIAETNTLEIDARVDDAAVKPRYH
jgi:hypothetical protein